MSQQSEVTIMRVCYCRFDKDSGGDSVFLRSNKCLSWVRNCQTRSAGTFVTGGVVGRVWLGKVDRNYSQIN